MPVFEFECSAGHVTETLVGITADSAEPAKCELCGRPVKRIQSRFASRVDTNYRDAVSGEAVPMTEEEKALHRGQQQDIERAHKAGKLRRYKKGKKTPREFQPSFEKALTNT